MKNVRNKIIQLQGKLSGREIAPQHYEYIVHIVEALLIPNCELAVHTITEIMGDQDLRLASRNWITMFQSLTKLCGVAFGQHVNLDSSRGGRRKRD